MIVPPVLDFYRLRRQQWLDAEELEKIQQEKLRTVIHHAYQNVRYYRRVFDSAGIRPEDIKTVDDLTKIPITRRKDLQQLSFEDITARNANMKRCKRLLTSGSSGMPLTVYRTGREDDLLDIVWARGFLEDGQKIWDKIAEYHFYHPIPRRWFEHLGIWSRTILSVLDHPNKQIETLRRVRPNIMRGNPLDLVSTAIRLQQARIEDVNPRLVFSLGSLLDQQSRAFIESTLHANVFDYYGSTELGCVAWECPVRLGHHINTDTLVVETINDDGQPVGIGERGNLVCTGLLSYTMPFIRYNIGDVGIITDEACACGRGLPLLKTLEGRADDFLVSADGSLISPSIIVNTIKSLQGMRQFKIVQESQTNLTAQVVLDENARPQTDQILKDILRHILGGEVSISIEKVDAIARDSSGKIRALVSKVRKSDQPYHSQ